MQSRHLAERLKYLRRSSALLSMLLTSSHISAQQTVVCCVQVCGCATGCTTKSSTVCLITVGCGQVCSSVCCITTGCATGCDGQAGCGLCPNAITPRPAKTVIAKLVMAFLICLFITSSMFRVQVNYQGLRRANVSGRVACATAPARMLPVFLPPTNN